VKDSLRNDPRYKSVKHDDRDVLFNEYISELKAAEDESEREAKAKREEQVWTFFPTFLLETTLSLPLSVWFML
jgi:hypothetical protein